MRNLNDKLYFNGRAFTPDSTLPAISIFRDPVVSAPAIVAVTDNIFAQSNFFLTSAFGAAAALARQARTLFRMKNIELGLEVFQPKIALELFYTEMTKFIKNETTDRLHASLLASSLVFLNVFYPSSHVMAGDVISVGVSILPAAIAALRTTNINLCKVVDKANYDSLSSFWAPFARTSYSAWDAISPLLLRFLENDGSFDLSETQLADVWRANRLAILDGAFLVASKDGLLPPTHGPLCGVKNVAGVLGKHLRPIMVKVENTEPRSGVVGVMPSGLQQIAALLLASASDKTTVVQYSQNFGGAQIPQTHTLPRGHSHMLCERSFDL